MANDNPTKPKSAQTKVQVTECRLLVPLSKSKKLSQLQSNNRPAPPPENTQASAIENPAKLKPETLNELIQAQKLIDGKIAQILNSFPENKKNKLFTLRFGPIDAIKTMPITAAFTVLGISSKPVKIRLIAGLNYHGQTSTGHS